ncbi:helix-turn-helix transcriptional regulator [Mucilaginibacter sp. cycad4]|uniref:helix-turn-helix domain-containing protein n=1 Tax=Mucilaginibacter sp. cycad4 TaxID=3342096 RepID=UPI002AAB1FBE|nr:helix-turn-helix transcriptional regulator [Mucilaginibacter gossypii]WPU99184.1 helix-turn-helix transcriptional regulator [Mucilaginibacter gossypii]
MSGFKQFSFKKFGYLDFHQDYAAQMQRGDYTEFIRILFVKAGGHAVIDFKEYQLNRDALFFINKGQYHKLDDTCQGTMLYYNRDFYCVEIHDKEVACDGILFHNVYDIPEVLMDEKNSSTMQATFRDIKAEIDANDSSMEEMLRILLKQIIIRSTRIWKSEHHVNSEEARQEVEFSRSFSQMVEWHYTKLHTVADYADMLSITPKALNKRISRYSNISPNDIIKNRIILEAKRLLVHTALSVKEIGYKLGYDDPSYFIRLFSKHAATSPQNFRLQYQTKDSGSINQLNFTGTSN